MSDPTNDIPYRVAHRICLLLSKTGDVPLPAAVDSVLLVLAGLVSSLPDIADRERACRGIREDIPHLMRDAAELRARRFAENACLLGDRQGDNPYPPGWETLAARIGDQLENVDFDDAIDSFRPVLAFLMAQVCDRCREHVADVLRNRLAEIPGISHGSLRLGSVP